jgi:adenylate cyclase class 2
MQYEVEQKHRVEDERALFERLAERGVEIGPRVEQSDQYFAHPVRDYGRTDEALRIRTVGDKCFVTYKGPKVDVVTKTRRELELPLHPKDEHGTRFSELLHALGFTPVAVVRKHRRPFQVTFENTRIEGALDEVEGLGTFVELELQADESHLENAKRLISHLAGELALGPTERRSYLEMLLGKT